MVFISRLPWGELFSHLWVSRHWEKSCSVFTRSVRRMITRKSTSLVGGAVSGNVTGKKRVSKPKEPFSPSSTVGTASKKARRAPSPSARQAILPGVGEQVEEQTPDPTRYITPKPVPHPTRPVDSPNFVQMKSQDSIYAVSNFKGQPTVTAQGLRWCSLCGLCAWLLGYRYSVTVCCWKVWNWKRFNFSKYKQQHCLYWMLLLCFEKLNRG